MSNHSESDFLPGNKCGITYGFETQAHYFQMTGYEDYDELRDLLLKETNDRNC